MSVVSDVATLNAEEQDFLRSDEEVLEDGIAVLLEDGRDWGSEEELRDGWQAVECDKADGTKIELCWGNAGTLHGRVLMGWDGRGWTGVEQRMRFTVESWDEGLGMALAWLDELGV